MKILALADYEPRLFLENVAYFDGRFSVIKLDGSLWRWSWGYNLEHVMDDVVAFSTWLAGGDSNMAITSDSRLWGWGSGLDLGRDPPYDQYSWHWNNPDPAQIWDDATQILRGWRNFMVITSNGELWDLTHGLVLVLERVAAASLGFSHSLALDFDGTLWVWEGEEEQHGFLPRPFGVSDDPRHWPARVVEGVLLLWR